MRRNIALAVACMAVGGLVFSSATAQQNDTAQNQRDRNSETADYGDTTTYDQQQNPNRRQSANQMKMKSVLRASKLIGMDVRNNADEDLGSIEDLVINPRTGEIEYAAISMGGFLGVGNELYAVPWKAIRCQPEEGADANDPDAEKVAIVDIKKDALKDAEGFSDDDWPDMADDQWRRQNDQPYHTSMRENQARTRAN